MADTDTPELELIEAVKRFLPVSWDNELDGHGEPTHAVLTFGDHQTQAITLQPDDWTKLNDIPDTIEALLSRVDKLEEALKKCRHKFLHYEDLHRLKCTAEGDEKADRNREMADMCDAALNRSAS